MNWTKEHPKEAGYYWVRPCLEIMEFKLVRGKMTGFGFGDPEAYNVDCWTPICEFYGPIPEPREPNPGEPHP